MKKNEQREIERKKNGEKIPIQLSWSERRQKEREKEREKFRIGLVKCACISIEMNV